LGHANAGAVKAAFAGRRGDEVDSATDMHRLAGPGHTDDDAEAVAGGVIRGKRGRSEKNDRNFFKVLVHFHDAAEILVADVLAFGFEEQASGTSVARMASASHELGTATTGPRTRRSRGESSGAPAVGKFSMESISAGAKAVAVPLGKVRRFSSSILSGKGVSS
jgi:hypothetical protein